MLSAYSKLSDNPVENMLSADNMTLSDNMLSVNSMMLSVNILSYFFSLKLHTLVEQTETVFVNTNPERLYRNNSSIDF
jgi:predicted transcriptional regulator of viral defense system